MPIRWRSHTEIDEENRIGRGDHPDRVVAKMSLKCHTCGGPIMEIHYADGHRDYDQFGVRSVLGEGVYHKDCR